MPTTLRSASSRSARPSARPDSLIALPFDPHDIPLLELDPQREAMIEPAQRYRRRGESLRAVICFFREVTTARSQGLPVIVEV